MERLNRCFVYCIFIGIIFGFYSMCCGQERDELSPTNQEDEIALPLPTHRAIAITRIGNADVIPNVGITLDTVNTEGKDVKIDVWGRPKDSEIWVLVNAQNTYLWRAYGPAKEEGGGIWTVHGVRLGEGYHQGKYFTLRAVILEKGKTFPSNETNASGWQENAILVSSPVEVTVLNRVVTSKRVFTSKQTNGIWISTIDGQCISPEDSMVVPPAARIAGTLKLRAGTQQKEIFVFVVVHVPGTDRWRIFGPAEINDIKWEMRDVHIADQSEPSWTDFDVFAIIAQNRLNPGPANYSTWKENLIASSSEIRVFVQRWPIIVDERMPEVTIKRIKQSERLPGKQESVEIVDIVDDFLEISAIEDVIEVEGTVKDLPHGASLWTLLTPRGSREWIVQDGPASVNNGTWTLKGLNSISANNNKTIYFELICVVSNATLPMGIIDHDMWRRNALAVSPTVIIKLIGKRKNPMTEIKLSISKVAGIKVHPGSNAQVPESGDIEGEVDGLPGGTRIWVGVHEIGTKDWIFYDPALVSENTWKVPDVIFQEENKQQSNPKKYEIIAIVTKGMLPGKQGPFSWWRQYALESSPTIHVLVASEKSKTGVKRNNNFPKINWIIWIMGALLILILIVLEYFFRLSSIISRYLAETFEEIYGYNKEVEKK